MANFQMKSLRLLFGSALAGRKYSTLIALCVLITGAVLATAPNAQTPKRPNAQTPKRPNLFCLLPNRRGWQLRRNN